MKSRTMASSFIMESTTCLSADVDIDECQSVSQPITRFLPAAAAHRLYSWHPAPTPLEDMCASPVSSDSPSHCSTAKSTSSTATTITTASSSTVTCKSVPSPRPSPPDTSTIWFDNFGTTPPQPPTVSVPLNVVPTSSAISHQNTCCNHIPSSHSSSIPSSPVSPPPAPLQHRRPYHYHSASISEQHSPPPSNPSNHRFLYSSVSRPHWPSRSSRSPIKRSCQEKQHTSAPRMTSLACFLPR